MTTTDRIRHFLSSAPRNRLVVLSHGLSFPSDIPIVDIGKELGYYAASLDRNDSNFPQQVNEYLNGLLHSHALGHGELLLENIGIVFEKTLGIDFLMMLVNFSRTTTIYLKWEGDIENNRLWFLTKASPNYIDLTNISHIIL